VISGRRREPGEKLIAELTERAAARCSYRPT
jgi:hypothetical protein